MGRRTRSLMQIALLTVAGHTNELKLHV